MKNFNLTGWALQHRAFTGFVMILLLLGGVFACFRIGLREDPDFTFRVMVVKTIYPGATAQEVELQLTDRLEKKIQELPSLNYLKSYSKPGESVIFVTAREDVPRKDIANLWYQVRKKVGDIRHTLPTGIIGPFFNDEFGDTYSAIYAFTGDGYSYAELKTYVDAAQQQLRRIKDVEKVDLIGEQTEKIFIEFSDQKLAELKLDARQAARELQAQNGLLPAGMINTPLHNVPIRLNGPFQSEASVRDLLIQINGHTIRVGDFATVRRAYAEPAEFKMRVNGKEAIGLGITLDKKADVLALGKTLAATMDRMAAKLPIGVEVSQVANQSQVVKQAIGEFLYTFIEALLAVLLVSFLSLGFRAGTIVTLTVPLVLAATLLGMLLFGIDVHRISLGALILGLGLLVDDAMIAIEMMARKLEQGWGKIQAATFAYQATALPMLTGTLITVAGFLPVGLAQSQAGEYTEAIFQVVALSLVLSWFGAVIFTPYLGFLLLKSKQQDHGLGHDLFDTPFYQGLRQWITLSLNHRKKIIVTTALLFLVGIWALLQVSQQFFPVSNRPEIIVDLWLPEGSSFAESEAAAQRLEALLAKDKDVVGYTAYIGGGTPRFFLLITQQLANVNLTEFVVMTKDSIAREGVVHRLRQAFAEGFPEAQGRPMRLSVGPPSEYPIIFRVTGENPDDVRSIAEQVAEVVGANPNTVDVNNDWHEQLASMRLDLDQDKARALGVSTESLSFALQAHYAGVTVGQLRENNQLIDIIWRAATAQRDSLDGLKNVVVPTANGKSVPLSQLVRPSIGFEDAVRWRRNRYPAISVHADLVDGVQPPDVADQIIAKLQPILDSLPDGYTVETGADKEEAWTAQKSILIWIPLVLIVTLILLMMQLQNLSRTFLVFMTAPLGIIGAAFALLLFKMPFGFVALLGIIALAGMIMRNSLILVDQIEQDENQGRNTWDAIIESTVRRFRPIMLTAAAAILAMIPLSFNDFFGPQAIAIMGGLIVATGLTIFFLPALYAAWFRVERPPQDKPYNLVSTADAGDQS